MPTLRALVVGVSNYKQINAKDLPLCINDVWAIKNALTKGLDIEKSNILTCGNNGTVTSTDFISSINYVSSQSNLDDTLIFYFSGHGHTENKKHYLVLSDSKISTQKIITFIENIKAKNKIIFIDSCYSGNFNVDHTTSFNINDTVEEFAGKGYAVFASCNATQVSTFCNDKPISIFTNFLCEAITDVHIIKKGKKSLNDIKQLLFFYMDMWNKMNPNKQQQPVFRANIGGTIYFKVQEYHAFCTTKIYEETEKYIIYIVEPLHNITAKRYVVKVILKNIFSYEEISTISKEIVNKIKKVNVYDNEISKKRWEGRDANLIFCYYCRDESDIINSNYICQTTWIDENQDKGNWYRLNESSAIINDVYFRFYPYYQNIKTFILNNTGDKDILIEETKIILSQLITLAEKVIALYNEYINNEKDENELIDDINKLIPLIEKYYFKETNLDIPPDELHDWSQLITNLASSIYELTLYYNQRYLAKRDTKNRRECMDMAINRYYDDLERLRKVYSIN